MKKVDFHAELRKQILSVCKIEHLTIKDCKEISEKIFVRDRNYLSENTIKRFFGFTNLPVLFSPFVLDSLSHFAGFKDWDDFLNQKQAQLNTYI
ncbi:hypothetical protein [Pedobacter aquatilis]|uniref:hypothetical protein n=1 Tax=Pedobacter aquatilis TaxID=351343 RepID=UPI00292F424A|nr:hypothetical protein [Pedobacter aquatilis]